MARLQADLIRSALAEDRRIDLVTAPALDRAADAVASTGARLVILGGRSAGETAAALLSAYPELRILEVTADGRSVLHDAGHPALPLGEVTPRRLAEAVARAATGDDARGGAG